MRTVMLSMDFRACACIARLLATCNTSQEARVRCEITVLTSQRGYEKLGKSRVRGIARTDPMGCSAPSRHFTWTTLRGKGEKHQISALYEVHPQSLGETWAPLASLATPWRGRVSLSCWVYCVMSVHVRDILLKFTCAWGFGGTSRSVPHRSTGGFSLVHNLWDLGFLMY